MSSPPPLRRRAAVPPFHRALLRWYRAHQRPLPWRETADPYAIWLSEVMLQQTTVATVTPRWRRFLDRWPTAADLAAAPLEEVLHEWTGLGYYARARNLHRAARVIAEEHGGRLPRTAEALRTLPGMGPYTAAAVASIAFGEPVAVLDANVERVLARLLAIGEDARSGPGKRLLREWSTRLLNKDAPGDHNQAMMELGATVCTPRTPACGACPAESLCQARQLGTPEAFPVLQKRPPMEQAAESAVVIGRAGRFLVLRRREDVSFGGMWELPRVRCEAGEDPANAAARAARELAGLSPPGRKAPEGPLLEIRHTVMRMRIHLRLYRARAGRGAVRTDGRWHSEARWVTASEWAALPKSTTMARIARQLLEAPDFFA